MQKPASPPPGGSAELIALHGPLPPYSVELLLAHRVPLDPAAVVEELDGASGEVEIATLPEGAFALVYLDHRTDFKDAAAVPMRHLVTYVERDGDVGGRRAALEQTWDWPDPDAPDGVDPAKYVAANPDNPIRRGALNVRMFRVANGEPGDMVMDTMGLAAFALRDLQVR